MVKKNESNMNYSEEIKLLKSEGAQRLYLLYGDEDYLREQFVATLKKVCIADGEEEFNCRDINGASLDMGELSSAVDAMPFMAERTLVLLRSFDINKCKAADIDLFKKIISDIPDYCTLAIILDTLYTPDGRLAHIKAVKSSGKALQFAAQGQGMLTDWVIRRFASLGKRISPQNAQQLMFFSGTLMNTLIPEITKIASYAKGEEISLSDIEKTASRQAEANAFEMCEMLGAGRFDDAAVLLSALLESREHPIMLLALIGQQMRRLYAVRLAAERNLSSAEGMELAGIKHDFIYTKAKSAANRQSLERAAQNVRLCAEYDLKMKSTGLDAEVLLKELFVLLATGVKA